MVPWREINFLKSLPSLELQENNLHDVMSLSNQTFLASRAFDNFNLSWDILPSSERERERERERVKRSTQYIRSTEFTSPRTFWNSTPRKYILDNVPPSLPRDHASQFSQTPPGNEQSLYAPPLANDGKCRVLIFASRLRRSCCSRCVQPASARARARARSRSRSRAWEREVNFTAWRAVQHGETTRDPVNSLVSRCIDPSQRLLRVAKGSRS